MTLQLQVRRTIRATPERLFAAWTEPAQLMRWWGPKEITCTEAHVDLKVGGGYRLANRDEAGHVIWIVGEFEKVVPPSMLVYSWRIGESDGPAERVTVRFEPTDGGTEVIVEHERIGSEPARAGHERGWNGCLDGLTALVEARH